MFHSMSEKIFSLITKIIQRGSKLEIVRVYQHKL